MKKWIGWIAFFLVVIGLAVGGFFLASHFQGETFQFKEVELLDWNDYQLNDFVEQDVVCNDKGCKFKDKDITFTISDVTKLGKQDVMVKMEYEGENFEKTFHVDVVDRVAPEIVLKETSIRIDPNEKIDPISYVGEVKDNYDTLNVEDISVDDQVDASTPGDYEVVYTIKDSSNNEGKATLKVTVRKEKTTTTSSNDKKVEEKKEETQKVTFNYNISGLFSDSGSLLQGKTQSLVEKNIELGWNPTLKITSNMDDAGTIRFIVSKNKIKGDELSAFRGALPQTSAKKVKSGASASFEYTFEEEGTFYVSLVILNQSNEIIIRKDFCLHISVADEVTDMKIVTEDYGDYLNIDCDFIGGGNQGYYFVVTLMDSDDPNGDSVLVDTDNVIRLYYTKGYTYEIMGMLVNEDEEIVMMKSLTIKK